MSKFTAVIVGLLFSSAVFASTVPTTPAPTPIAAPAAKPAIIPTAPELNSKGYVLMDANTGMVLAHKNMHERMEPASLTKLMTLYLTSEALQHGQIKLTDQVRVSKRAWQTGGSRMFIKAGSDVTVQDLINGIIVASGNDACVALSQYVGGNEATFVSMMNQAAQQLGMSGTHFMDSTGLPDPQHYTTPYDIALLARAIIEEFPQDYTWYKQKWITYNNIKQPNRNRLLWRDTSVDGLKTGHTDEAGYCLVSSALRNNTRLVAVVMGSPTDSERANDSEALLNWGFRFFHSHKLYDSNTALAHPRVFLGSEKTVPVGLAKTLYVTIPAGSYSKLQPQLDINAKLKAPIQAGQTVGMLTVKLENGVVSQTPLVALKADPTGGIFSRGWDHLMMIL